MMPYESDAWQQAQIDAAPSFLDLRNKLRTARKEHKCSYCKGSIYPGEQYRDVVFIQDGEFGAVKDCGHCHEPNK